MLGALVDNALRHTPDGGWVRLSATAAEVNPEGERRGRSMVSEAVVRIAVEDTGPGFPPGAVDRVFERFYQADSSRSRETGTSGLGMSIVRALAEAQDGRTGAENVPAGGARVWIDLRPGPRA
jgi:two-component system sensor histidine kinase BaeS